MPPFSLSPLLWALTGFALSMAYIEAAVVVYLWELYYPEGFHFPLKILSPGLVLVEIGREAATLAMLGLVALVAGRTKWLRLACFMFVFGLWDIFYYFWLKVLRNWPPSLLEWDLLFLIPLPWAGPVLAPVIVAGSMVVAALVILRMENASSFQMTRGEGAGIFCGAALILLSFLWDSQPILNQGVPTQFHWEIFGAGELLGLAFFLKAVHGNSQ